MVVLLPEAFALSNEHLDYAGLQRRRQECLLEHSWNPVTVYARPWTSNCISTQHRRFPALLAGRRLQQ